MAQLTRQTANSAGTPTDEMVVYYARRAGGGCDLIISEGAYEDDAHGARAYLSQPGMADCTHVTSWRNVTDAVHKQAGAIILQLMHGGRVVEPRCLPTGQLPLSASATRSPGWVLYSDGEDEKFTRDIRGDWPKVTFGVAKALRVTQIAEIVRGFAEGARRAVKAGFDGVKIHGANGYLIYQFMHHTTN